MSRVLDAVRIVFGRETIADLPARHIDPFRMGLFSWIFGREALPRDEPSPRKEGLSVIPWLFGSEDLPLDEPQAPPPAASPPFLGTLFARERLPGDERPGEPGLEGGAPPKQG